MMASIATSYPRLFVLLLVINTGIHADVDVDLPTVATRIISGSFWMAQTGIGDYLMRVPDVRNPPRPNPPMIEVECKTSSTLRINNATLSLVNNISTEAGPTSLPITGSYTFVSREVSMLPGVHIYACRLSGTRWANRSNVTVETAVRLRIILADASTNLTCASSLGTTGFPNETTILNCAKLALPRAPPSMRRVFWAENPNLWACNLTAWNSADVCYQLSSPGGFMNQTFTCHYQEYHPPGRNVSKEECSIGLRRAGSLIVSVSPDTFVGNGSVTFNCSTDPASPEIQWRISGRAGVVGRVVMVSQQFGTSLLDVNARSMRGITSVECVSTRNGFRNSARSTREDRASIPAGTTQHTSTIFTGPRFAPVSHSTSATPISSSPISHFTGATPVSSEAPGERSTADSASQVQGPVVGAAAAGVTLLVILMFFGVACITYRKVSKTDASQDTIVSDVFPSGTEATSNPAYQSYDDGHQQSIPSAPPSDGARPPNTHKPDAYPLPDGTEATLNSAYQSYDDECEHHIPSASPTDGAGPQEMHQPDAYPLPEGTEAALNAAYQSYDNYTQYQTLSGPQAPPVYSSLNPATQYATGT